MNGHPESSKLHMLNEIHNHLLPLRFHRGFPWPRRGRLTYPGKARVADPRLLVALGSGVPVRKKIGTNLLCPLGRPLFQYALYGTGYIRNNIKFFGNCGVSVFLDVCKAGQYKYFHIVPYKPYCVYDGT